jgi:hypothetical protein
MFAYINSVARFHLSSTALPITTVLMIVLLWALGIFPLLSTIHTGLLFMGCSYA